MTKYLLIFNQHYSENTSQYGYGDFPDKISYLGAVVEADTVRKAQNKVKKLFPRVRFGGIGSPWLIDVASPEFQYHWVQELIGPYDRRLSERAKDIHCAAIDSICKDASEYLAVLNAANTALDPEATRKAVLSRLAQ